MKKTKDDVVGAPLFPTANKAITTADDGFTGESKQWNTDFGSFPMQPLAITGFARAIIEEIPLKEFVTKTNIAIVSPAGQPGQKRTYPLGRVLAISQIMLPDGTLKPFPEALLKPGDIVSFNDMVGNWQRLRWGADHIECGVIGSMDIIAKFTGSLEDISIPSVQPLDGAKKNNITDVGTISSKKSHE